MRLFHRCSLEAPPHTIREACEIYGGPESNEWLETKEKFSCIDDRTKTSYLSIMFLIIGNHSPGGEKGEGLLNSINIIAFLDSPGHRASLHILKDLYRVHKDWAEFLNRKSDLNPPEGGDVETISTRALECSVEHSKMLAWVHGLSRDWTKILPTSFAYLQKESEFDAIRCKGPEVVFPVINEITTSQTLAAAKKVDQYMRDPFMTVGLCYTYTSQIRFLGYTVPML